MPESHGSSTRAATGLYGRAASDLASQREPAQAARGLSCVPLVRFAPRLGLADSLGLAPGSRPGGAPGLVRRQEHRQGTFLCASFTLAGGGVGRLVYEAFHRTAGERLERASAARSRFRAVLTNELRTRALGDVKFAELVASSGVARQDADKIADDLFKKVIDKFLADDLLSDR